MKPLATPQISKEAIAEAVCSNNASFTKQNSREWVNELSNDKATYGPLDQLTLIKGKKITNYVLIANEVIDETRKHVKGASF